MSKEQDKKEEILRSIPDVQRTGQKGGNSIMSAYMDRKLENLFVLKYLLELKRHDLEQKEIYRIQNRKINRLMKRAYEIPVYRRKFEAIGAVPEDFHCREDLTRFPVLTKSEIKEWITAELKKNPKKYQYYHVYTTSGSTGTPLKLCASPRENAYFAANWLRIAMENGVNPIKDQTMALKDPAIVARGKDSFLQKLGILRRHKVSFLAEGKVIAEEINRVKPDFLYAHRTKLMQTAEYASRHNVKLHHPRAYASISETLTEQSIRFFRKYLGNRLFTSYGSMETGACTFTRIGNIREHIVTNDTHVINVVDEENRLAKAGRMLVTNLFLYEFPIINYDIEDGAEIIRKNGIEYITNIRGRRNDWITLEDGRKYDYHPFYAATESLEELLNFRVIQNNYHEVELELVADPGKKVDKELLEKEITGKLEQVITDYDMKYHFIWKSRIEADKAGKLRFIVNRVKEGNLE